MAGEDPRDVLLIAKRDRLLCLLGKPDCVRITGTAQRDIAILDVDPPLTLCALLDRMKKFLDVFPLSTQIMDSGEEAFVFRFIRLESRDSSFIDLYVKAKFGNNREQLTIFAAHPDRRW